MQARTYWVIALGVVGVLCAAYFLYQGNVFQKPITATTTPPGTVASTTGSTADMPLVVPQPRKTPPGISEYKNIKYRFAILYPSHLRMSEFNEGGGAMTITFQSVSPVAGFQVFITPYDKEQVTDERFKMDIPSGIMKDPVNVVINGAAGTAFVSTHDFLGETREIWFIRGGYLYEVTTARSLEEPLLEVMKSWIFF